MNPQRYEMPWVEFFARLNAVDLPGELVYGVPRGGMIASAFLSRSKAVHDPRAATVILDDIVDSGTTRTRYEERFPSANFVALVDKQGKDADLGWVVFPWEKDHPNASEQDGNGATISAEDAVIRQLQFIGEDVKREGLLETPKRVIRSWGELFGGYQQDPVKVIKSFTEGTCDEMVLLKNVEFYSTCEHHMLPFFGRAHVAYIPKGRVIGVSKLARVLDIFARRLQIQERIGQQVTEALMAHLQPHGAACIIEAQHFCMKARGVQKQDSVMVTSSLKGVFLENAAARAELMGLVGR
jgi:GTP cyclohydrolase I